MGLWVGWLCEKEEEVGLDPMLHCDKCADYQSPSNRQSNNHNHDILRVTEFLLGKEERVLVLLLGWPRGRTG